MEYIWESLTTALSLIWSLDSQVLEAVSVSLEVSILAVLLASLVGIPLGTLLVSRRFFGRRLVMTVINTLMGLPTVAVGLGVYGLISRQGPLGGLELLFSLPAIVIGQFILVTPIVIGLTVSAVASADARVVPTARALGASDFQASLVLLRESRFGLMAAVSASFGRAISEVGVAMILGGNIKGFTRTLTTAIALETGKGGFSLALALGLVLLTLSFGVNIIFNILQKK
ncbi:MAG: ABC transporter permease [Thermodesulfobacteriota bacterium]